MMSDYRTKKILINEIYSLLDKSNESLAPLLRRSIRLAELCAKEEYRILFDIHLDGIDLENRPKQGRVKKWKDKKIAPLWNPLEVFCEDRKAGKEKYFYNPIEELEFNLEQINKSITDAWAGNSLDDARLLVEVQKNYRNILIKIRNRIGLFLREIEGDITRESNFLRETKTIMATYAEKEYKVLKTIYDLSEGQSEKWIMIDDLEKSLELSRSEFYSILKDLEDRKGLIDSVDQAVWIVPAGIEQIEKTKSNPEKATNIFPANIYNNTFNAPVVGIQQGGQNNTQNNNQNINPEFTKAINDLLTMIENSSLNPVQKINTKSDVRAISDLAALDKSPEVLELAESKIEAVKDVISMTADITSLGMVLIPILQAAFGS